MGALHVLICQRCLVISTAKANINLSKCEKTNKKGYGTLLMKMLHHNYWNYTHYYVF